MLAGIFALVGVVLGAVFTGIGLWFSGWLGEHPTLNYPYMSMKRDLVCGSIGLLLACIYIVAGAMLI